MKKSIFFVLTVLISTITYSQVWEQTYGGSGIESGKSILGDSFISDRMIVGSSNSFGLGDQDVYVVKTNSNGDTLWTRTYGDGFDNVANSVCNYFSGGKLGSEQFVAGFSSNGSNKDAYSVIIGWDGTPAQLPNSWDGGFGDDEILYISSPNVNSTHATGYVTNSSGNKDLNIWEIDFGATNVDTNWTRSFDAGGDDIATCYASPHYDTLIVAGYSDSYGGGDQDIVIATFDMVTRTFLSSFNIGGTGDDIANHILYNSADETYLITGQTNSYGAVGTDYFAILLNANLDTIWMRTYGGSGDDIAVQADLDYNMATDTYDYVLAGYSNSFGAADNDIYLIKIEGATGDTLWTKVIGEAGIDETASGIISMECFYHVSGTKGDSVYFVASEKPAFDIHFSVDQISCNGYNNGYITAMYDNSNYDYNWSQGGSGYGYIYNLAPGNYVVTVTSFAGWCSSVDSVEIVEPPLLIATIDDIRLGCIGACDKEITVSVSGGVPPYSFGSQPMSKTGNKGVGGPGGFTDLCAGYWEMEVSDSNSCSVLINTDIVDSILTPVVHSLDTIHNGCFNVCEGQASVYATGGGGVFTYQWDDPLMQTSDTILNLCADLYHITVTDTNNCIIIDSVEVFEPPPYYAVIIDSLHNTCFGDTMGMAEVMPGGGVSPYTYLWSNGDNSPISSDLTAGVYTVTVYDATGCEAVTYFEVKEPSLITPVSTVDDVTCFGGNDGYAAISVSGGVSPYNYLWQGGSIASDTSNLTAGKIYYSVTDAVGCMVDDSVTILQPDSLEAVISAITDVNCYGLNNGNATATALGGIPPYTFVWDAQTGGQTGIVAIGLSVGNYNVSVTDDHGCVSANTAIVYQPDSLAIIFTKTDVLCFGDATGEAVGTVTGGLAPYTYLWSNGSVSDSIFALEAGTYILFAEDANLCSVSGSVIVNENAALEISLSAIAENCGTSDGSASVSTLSGGLAPYTYEWSGSQIDSSITGLTPGNYSVTVTDINSCSVEASIDVGVQGTGTVSISSDSILCYGETTSATATVTSGTAPYAYQWSTGHTSQMADNLPAGLYAVTSTDVTGCTAVQSVNITQPDSLQISFSFYNPLCNGGTDGSASASISGGVSPYTYLWSDQSTSDSVSNLSAGNYYLFVEDANGCMTNGGVLLIEQDAITISLTSSPANCGAADGSASITTVTGGSGNYIYLWSDGQVVADAISLLPGDYQVTVTDDTGCYTEESVFVSSQGTGTPTISAQQILCYGGTGSATATMADGIPPFTYGWSDGQTLQTAINLAAGNYDVTITDNNGCAGITSIIIDPAPEQLSFYITTINASCQGCDGSATAIVTGGVTPYNYLWSDGQSENAASMLCGDSPYYMTLTDANGCMESSGTYVSGQALPVLQGSVLSGSDYFDSGDVTVELYREVTNSDIQLELFTGSEILAGGTFQFTDLWPDTYFMRVVLNDEAGHPNLINTYYANTYSWDAATPINLMCNSAQTINVNMYEVFPPSGDGSITGTITYMSDNKAVGDPVPGAEVYIEQEPSDDPIANVETDTTGSYEFDNIPYGDGYKLTVDIPGYPLISTHSNISINSGEPVVEDMNFIVDSSDTGGIFADSLTSVFEIANADFDVKVHPNPFLEALDIDFVLNKPDFVSIEVFDEMGRLVSTLVNCEKKAGVYNVKFYSEDRSSAIFFLKFNVGQVYYVKKIVKI